MKFSTIAVFGGMVALSHAYGSKGESYKPKPHYGDTTPAVAVPCPSPSATASPYTQQDEVADATPTTYTGGEGMDNGTPTEYAGAITIVTVGLANGTVLKFDPPFLQNQQKGDIIRFDFRAVNHTLTESSFDDPCKKLANTTVDTNFNNVNRADIPNFKPFDFTLDTNADEPRWFYCKQGNGTPNGHCGRGMVFAINPKSEQQFAQFLDKAEATIPKVKGRGLKLGQMA